MSLDVAVAVPFRQAGRTRLGEGEFVVALSLDRDWFSPDQAKRLLDVAAGRGLLSRDDNQVIAEFDPDDVDVPTDFVPEESILHEQSTFERVLDAVVASGVEKQAAVAEINRRQRELGVTLETAAVLYATRNGIEVDGIGAAVVDELKRS
jgi:hypothetical protein